MMKRKKRMLDLQLSMLMGILIILYYGLSTADSGLGREDAQRAEEAIRRAALECYSIKGAYPQSLEYLRQHYGLYVQEDAYHIRYRYIGANIMPDTDVYPRSEQP